MYPVKSCRIILWHCMVFDTCCTLFQTLGQPIQARFQESEERPKAFEDLGKQIQQYMKTVHAFKAKVFPYFWQMQGSGANLFWILSKLLQTKSWCSLLSSWCLLYFQKWMLAWKYDCRLKIRCWFLHGRENASSSRTSVLWLQSFGWSV